MTGLFDELPRQDAPAGASGGSPRLREAERDQVALHLICLDDLLAPEHEARAVWGFVERLDLTALYAAIKSVEGGGGHPAADPKVLVSLWLYATLQGVGSARELARLCESHIAYRWLCGGVGVNHRLLAEFRTRHVAWLDAALTASVAALLHPRDRLRGPALRDGSLRDGAATLQRVAQDGMRVRAAAGAASFRRGPSLRACREAAAAQVAALKAEADADPTAGDRRRRAARERAARERLARVEAALAALPDAQARRERNGGGEARVSTTDAEARVMKMADGGWRPAYNVQFATDTASHGRNGVSPEVVVGVEVACVGSDQPCLEPMADQIASRYARLPPEYLVDGGFVSLAAIERLSERGVTVYAPPPASRSGRAAADAREDDGPAVAAWRARMQTEAAKAIYRERAATSGETPFRPCECVNAHARRRGLTALRVRGSAKVRAVALWHALAHNLARTLALPAQAAA